MSEAVLLQQVGPVATVTLNRPERRNAFDLEMAQQFRTQLRALAATPEIRIVLLQGAGPAFSAGGDIKAMAQTQELPRFFWDISEAIHEAVLQIRRMHPPVVAVCNGPVSGVAFGVVTACDLRLASRTATFHAGTTRLGLAPNGGLTYFLPRLIGRGRAEQLILTGEKISAEQAHAWGLVDRLAVPEQLEATVEAMTQSLLQGAPCSQHKLKELLEASDSELVAQLKREQAAISESAGTEDFREGIAAFLEKRDPVFQGQ